MRVFALWSLVPLLAVLSFGCGQGNVTIKKEVCNNAVDDDADGKTDCSDPDCFSFATCCVDRCDEGTSLCSNAGVQSCTRGSNGCRVLSAPQQCTGGTVCSGGSCVLTCSDRCTAGAKQCIAAGATAECAQLATGCYDWVVGETCGTDSVCSGGACTPVASCMSQCSAGAARCTTNGAAQTCVALGNGCSDWTFPQTCNSGFTCSQGQCVPGGSGGGGGTTGGGGGATGGGGGATGGGGGATGGGGGSTGGGGGATGGGGGTTGGGGGTTGGGGGTTGGGGGTTGGGGGATGGGGGATGGGGGATGGGGGTCTSGLSLCGGRCIDVRIDANNCNLCGRVCAAGQTCSNGTCTSSSVNGLVFSEINPGLSTIELFNGGSAAVNLLNYSLQYTLGDGGTGSLALPSYDVPPQGFAVLGRGPADAGYVNAAAISLKTTDFALRLLNPSASGVDFVRTGASMVPPPTGTAWTGTNPPNPTVITYQSLVRNLSVVDSDTSADWNLAPNASPMRICARPGLCGTSCLDLENDRSNCGGCGTACAGTQVCRSGQCVAGGGRLLISEFRIDPVPMVEVYNPGPSPVVLDGYRVQVAATGTFLFTFPGSGRTLPPGKFVAIYAAPGADDFNTVYSGMAPPSGAFIDTAAVTVFDGTMGVDFVRFGSSTATPPAGISWFGNGVTYPPVSSADLSVHRKIDAIDSDDALNFTTFMPSTTGFACNAGMTLCNGVCVNLASSTANCGQCGNTCTAPQTCAAGTCSSAGGLVLSRISNVAPERIELYNSTTASMALDGYSVEWVSESGTDTFTIPNGTMLAAGGVLTLIEGSGTSTASQLFMNKSLVWTTELAVSLKNPSAMGIDFVRTGASTALPATGTTWMGNNAPNPADTGTEALERNVFIPDTNSAADWSLVTFPTLGAICSASTTVCGTSCVNTQTDQNNCGACGVLCPQFQCGTGQCRKAGAVIDNGRVRLVNGNGINNGRLEVFSGSWGQVCDDSFSVAGATVVCRDLGFQGMSNFSSTTGPNDTFLLDDVACVGNEATLLSCPHAPIGSENCTAPEAVFIQCTD
ncbi:MAG: lamin tail domain-containing protein [Archangium sp.]